MSRQRPVLVVGAGLIGTSVGLTLRARGHPVFLDDVDPRHLATAERLGAGRRFTGEAVDVAVVAVPPQQTGQVVNTVLRQAVQATVMDTASVKTLPQGEVESIALKSSSSLRSAGLDRFVGGHPLAGRERGGPQAGRADLFTGRPWVLTPSPISSQRALADARWLASECGAVPVVMSAADHDAAVAVTSHLPQLVASALAGQLVHESDAVLGLVGQGFRDMTRIAASEPELWADIAVSNAAPLAAAIARLVTDLSAVRDALQGAADQRSRRSQPAVRRLLRSGQAGHARIPGKHGGAPRRYDTVPVLVPDQPGALAKLFADAGRAGINIEDLRVDHAPGMPVGVVELLVRPSASPRLRRELTQRGWELTGR